MASFSRSALLVLVVVVSSALAADKKPNIGSAVVKGLKKPVGVKVANANATAAAATTIAATTVALTTPAPPPPPKNCDDEGKCAEANKKCNAQLKCICDVHLREISDGTCVPKPQFGEVCFDNVTWLECYGPGVDPTCNNANGPSKGKCICAKGYEARKTGSGCQPIKKLLGEACRNDAECTTAYTACSKGKCSCVEGFSSDGKLCSPQERNCPAGKPKAGANGAVQECVVDFDDKTGNIGDNCGQGLFCLVAPHTVTKAGKPIGHCCPTPATGAKSDLICPYGQPLKDAVCPDRKSGQSDKESTCPLNSHQCFGTHFRPHEMTCCPSPCRQSVAHFDSEGRCYSYALLGEQCEIDAQCTGEAVCVGKDGQNVCQCGDGYVQLSANQCTPKGL